MSIDCYMHLTVCASLMVIINKFHTAIYEIWHLCSWSELWC